jgi:hypothetical protein
MDLKKPVDVRHGMAIDRREVDFKWTRRMIDGVKRGDQFDAGVTAIKPFGWHRCREQTQSDDADGDSGPEKRWLAWS